MVNVWMRSFDMAMIRESYLGSLRPRSLAEEDGYHSDPSVYAYECHSEDCPCDNYRLGPTPEEDSQRGEEGCPCRRIHMTASIDGECRCDRIDKYPVSNLDDNEDNSSEILHSSGPENFPKRSPSIPSSAQSYNWRYYLSDDEALEYDLISFDFLLSCLVPQDSPLFSNRILSHLPPGCEDCHDWQAHPLPKYEQYDHDMRQLNKLLNDREGELSDFTYELIGSEHWEHGYNIWVSGQKLQHKVDCMLGGTDILELGQKNRDLGVEELAELLEAGLHSYEDRMRELERQMGWEELQELS